MTAAMIAYDRFGSAPTFSECVIGYRAWVIGDDAELRPIIKRTLPWQPGLNSAICKPHYPAPPKQPHAPPAAGCHCGFYALHDIPPLLGHWMPDPVLVLSGVVPVLGAVAAYGRLEVHETGFRAEHAGVVALAVLPCMGPWAKQRVRAAAARYGVRCVPIDQLRHEAARHGSPLPESVRPATLPGRARLGVRLVFDETGVNSAHVVERAPHTALSRRLDGARWVSVFAVSFAVQALIGPFWIGVVMAIVVTAIVSGFAWPPFERSLLRREQRRNRTAAS